MPDSDTKNTELGSQALGSTHNANGGELAAGRKRSSASWFRLAPNLTLAILVLIAAVLGLLMLQLELVDRARFWLMAALFVLMVWKRSSLMLASLFAVLASLVITKSFFFPRFSYIEGLDEVYASDITFAVLLLGFAGTCFRFLETKKYCLGVLSKFGWGRGLKKESLRSNLGKEFPSLLGGRWWLIPVSVVSAILLLDFFPFDPTAVQKYWVKAKPMRLILLVGTLFLVWFVIRSLFMLIMRWKMDTDQAGVHTRSVIAKEFWREHRAIESRRARVVRDGSKRQLRRERKSFTQDVLNLQAGESE